MENHRKESSILACGGDPALLERMLLEEGYSKAVAVADGRSALSILEQGGGDLLLLDTETPGCEAAGLIRHIRERFLDVELPILILTAPEDGRTRRSALEAGANDFLNKPVDPAELSFRIENLFSQLSVRNVYRAHQATRERLEREVAARTAKLDLLIENGLMMSMERDRSKLLRHIIFEGQRLLNCDGGTIYLVHEEKSTGRKFLRFTLRTKSDALPSVDIPLTEQGTDLPNEKHVSTYVALHKQSVLIDDVYRETRFDLAGTRRYDRDTGYRTVSMLTVPMATPRGEVLGIVQFMNAMEPAGGAIIPFSADLVPLVEALASQAAAALDNQRLIEAQKILMESLIRVVATAIDAKSPYTGRHCERVPVLALMLAEEASRSQEGPLAGFAFRNEEEWQEFRIGAWLHDCGKVTTPEYVIDKATKLETIHNRIHEVRMRFEVLLRDARIEYLESLAEGEAKAEADARLAAREEQLQEDFAFLAECNQGSEAMTEDRIERVRQIAEETWIRHFDDRLGLSQEESSLHRGPPLPLPVRERLLADRPEHLVPRTRGRELEPNHGFKVDVPEYLYNHGEVYNLCIRHGTLTCEERYKVNEHMIQGIMMLEQMPFPKSLQRVPEYAGTHHETLDGKGYPRRLRADQLSVPARIMAIADVFEALTANDRPYKKANKLSEALRILYGMKASGMIDPDLFDLFLSSGVYRRYAAQYLDTEQIDSVDINVYLEGAGGVEPEAPASS